MMSAMSSASIGTWISLGSSAAISASHPSTSVSGPSAHTIDRRLGTAARTARACSSSSLHVNITEISAWPRIATISGVDRRVFAGTMTAPALCTAAYATIQRRQ